MSKKKPPTIAAVPGSAALSAAFGEHDAGAGGSSGQDARAEHDARAPSVSALTEEQQRAVTTREVSVGLSAGAGCGKTFVLTERFLSELDPQPRGGAGPAKLGQLIAITFTERAAREMRDRIREACSQRLKACPADQVDYWRELVRDLDAARISTIHSFCASLLRAHAVEARLDPRFRVLEQAQADTLLVELLGEHLHDRLAERDDAVIELVVQFGLERLRRMIAILLSRRQEIAWPQWRGMAPEALAARWQQYWQNTFLPLVLQELSTSPPARELLKIAGRHCPTHAAMRQRCETLRQRLATLPESRDPPADLELIYEAAKVQGGGGAKAWPSAEIYERFRDVAAELREAIKKVKQHCAFDAAAARPAAETALRLLAVADGVAETYEAKKQQLAVLDFNDLLIRARQLLTAAEHVALRHRLAAGIRLLLVDEFQDTDPLQVELVEALCGEQLLRGRLFFVGDYKQSIYRFRGAQPHIFRQLREKMPEKGRLPLSLNFRSQPAILDFVNALFCDTLGPDYEPLRARRPQVGRVPAVELLWAADAPGARGSCPPKAAKTAAPPETAAHAETAASAEAATDMGEAERMRRREAEWIARRIRALLDSDEKIVWDKEAAKKIDWDQWNKEPTETRAFVTRPVRAGDVAILFRALSNVELYEDALRRQGIAYYLVGGHAFYSQQEVFDLLNLLRAVCSANDEVSLAGVLRSPMFGLWDETLFWLAQHPDGFAAGVFAERLPAELTDQQRQRVQSAAATLRDLRAIKDRLPVALWLNEALARTGYDAALLAEFLGERKLANLQKLIEQARSFDRSGIFTLADFATQLSEFVARQPDEALAATQPESADVVRLMTIHQAKGLEFPVVIVPDIDRVRRGPASLVAFTSELGPMVKDAEACSGFDLYQWAQRSEEHAELLRLLYVATTRAADYLILSAGVPELGSAQGPWTQLLQSRFDLSNGTLCADLPPGYRVPEIEMTMSEPALTGKQESGGRGQNLHKLVEEARETAVHGAGSVPGLLAPIAPRHSARRQFSFSRLSGILHGPAPTTTVAMPSSEGDAEPILDPRGLGTLIHAVLAEIDFARPGDIAPLVRRQALRHLPDVEGRPAEPLDMLERFLASPRAASLAAACEVHTELEFLLAWPPGETASRNGNISLTNAGQYIQGFIDCLYRDPSGRWRLLDYKTNRVAPADIASLAAQYEMQMLVYALAAERILKQPPEELVLCFLRPGLEYPFPWNERSRRRAVELVERAIAERAGS